MSITEIHNRILKSESVEWKKFSFLQSKKFKKIGQQTRARLRHSILNQSFVQPFHIWEHGDTLYCLDGYHRCQVLQELEREGVTIPPLLSANFIECTDKKEAAELVLVYSSRYAEIVGVGLQEFIMEHELDLAAIQDGLHIPELDLATAFGTDSSTPVEVVDEDISVPSRPPIVQRGDVFKLGPHVLMCGDSSSLDDVLKILDGEKVSGIVTSPPYAQQRQEQYGGVPSSEYCDWFFRFQQVFKEVLLPNGSFFLNIKPHCDDGERDLYVHELVIAMSKEYGWRFTEEYIWTHQGYPGALQGRFKNQFEPVYHFTLSKSSEIKFRPENVLGELSEAHYEKLERRKNGKLPESKKDFKGQSGMGNMHYYEDLAGARPGNVLRFNLGANSDHPATFPVALPTFFIQSFSDKGDAWFEPFGGSGTTLMACEATGRVCRAVEIQQQYVEMIIQRWVKHCARVGREIEFAHINGTVKVEDIVEL